MAANTNTSHSPPFALPMRYITFGVLMFGLFAVQLLVEGISNGVQVALMPAVVALTHLLTLGVLLSFVTGAVYQLTTVAFLIPIRNVRLASANFWLYILGFAGLWFSMLFWSTIGLVVFGTLVTISIYVYSIIIISSLSQTTVKGVIRWFIQLAHIYLLLAITTAWVIILSIHYGIWSHFYMELLATHILLATLGFFTCLIIGFSFKLFPMFTLSHGFSTKRQAYTFSFVQAGLWLLLLGIWTHLIVLLVLGGASMAAAFVSHALDLREMAKKRMRKIIETPIRYVIIATLFGLASSLISLAVSTLSGGLVQWQSLISFYLLAWILLTVMGYAYKIVPFLIWNKRYGSRAGKEKVPMMAELFDLKKSRIVFALVIGGQFLFPIGTILGVLAVAMIGVFLLVIAIGMFVWQMLQILKLQQLRRELFSHD